MNRPMGPSRFLSRVLRSGLMVSAAVSLSATVIATGAEADVAMMLQPDSGWAVSKIGGAAAGGASYCALARRYSNGMVLTLARNGQDESSMAIDFQRDGALDAGASYNVTLHPNDEQERSFNVRPVSGRALVVRLGKDYAFYDALNRAPSLNVQIGSNTYAFNMMNFASGQQQINSCLAGLGAPATASALTTASPAATAAAAPETLTPAPPPTAVTAEINAAPVVPDLPRRVHPASSAEISPSSTAGDDTAAATLRMKNDELKTALDKARREAGDRDAETKRAAGAELALNDKLDELQKENDALRNQTPTPAADADDVRQLKDQNALLLQQLDAMRAPAPAAMPKQVSAADRKMDNASAKLASANVKIDDADQRLAAAEQRLAAIEPGAGASSDADRKLADANAKLALADRKMSDADQKLIAANQKAAQSSDAAAAATDAASQKLAAAQTLADEATGKEAAADAKIAEATQKEQLADRKMADGAQHDGDASQRLALADQRLEDAAAKLADANQKLAAADVHAGDAEHAGKAAQADAAQKLADAQARLQDANRRMADADAKMQDAARKLATADTSISALQRLADAQVKLAQADRKLAEAAKLTDAVNGKDVAADARVADATAKTQAAEQKLADRIQHDADKDQRLADTSAKLFDASQKLATVQDAATQRAQLDDRKIAEARSEAQAAAQKLADRVQLDTNANQRLADASINVFNTTQQLSAVQARLEMAQKAGAVAQADAARQTQLANQKVAEATQAAAAAKADATIAAQKMQMDEQKVAQGAQRELALGQQLAQAKAQTADRGQIAQTLQADEQKLAASAQREATLGQRLAQVEAQATQLGDQTQKLQQDEQQKLAAGEQREAALGRQLAQAKDQATEAGQRLAAVQTQADDNGRKVAADETKLTQADQKLDDANKALHAAQVQMALAVQPAVGGAADADAQHKMDEAAQKTALADKRVADADTRAQAADEKLTAANKEIEELQHKVALDAAIVAAGRQAVASVQPVNADDAVIAGLQTQVKALQAENAHLTQQVADNNNKPGPALDAQTLQKITDQLSEVTTERDELRAEVQTLSHAGKQTIAAKDDSALLKLSSYDRPADMPLRPRLLAPVPPQKPDDFAPKVSAIPAAEQEATSTPDTSIHGKTPVGFMSAEALAQLLGPSVARAGIAAAGPHAFHWQVGALLGSSQQRVAEAGKTAFDGDVASYLAHARSRCDGAFAAQAGPVAFTNGVHTASYEIACVGQAESAGASLLFFSRDGIFTTIALEGSLDVMEAAMDLRDRVLSQALQTRIAMN